VISLQIKMRRDQQIIITFWFSTMNALSNIRMVIVRAYSSKKNTNGPTVLVDHYKYTKFKWVLEQ